MRYTPLALPLLALIISGCASHSDSTLDGIWVNENAIEAAVEQGNLRKALLANGPNLEWKVDLKGGHATFSNGFELGEGTLASSGKNQWSVDFYGNYKESLTLDGDELIQAASDSGPEQTFVRGEKTTPADAPPGATFEDALYTAYMGGDWKVVEGTGKGSVVHFRPDGRIEGLSTLDRYALCLAGDCAAMSGEYDTMWLEKDQRGAPFIFKRDGKRLEVFQAVNKAGADEMPDLQPGNRQWVFEK